MKNATNEKLYFINDTAKFYQPKEIVVAPILLKDVLTLCLSEIISLV